MGRLKDGLVVTLVKSKLMETTGADIEVEDRVGVTTEGEETVEVDCTTKVDDLVITVDGPSSSSESNALMSIAALFCAGLRVSLLGQVMGGLEIRLPVEVEGWTMLLG